MATHSSVLAWRIPGTVGPGGLPSVGSHRVGHDWSDLAAAYVDLIHLYVATWLSPWRSLTAVSCHIIIIPFFFCGGNNYDLVSWQLWSLWLGIIDHNHYVMHYLSHLKFSALRLVHTEPPAICRLQVRFPYTGAGSRGGFCSAMFCF